KTFQILYQGVFCHYDLDEMATANDLVHLFQAEMPPMPQLLVIHQDTLVPNHMTLFPFDEQFLFVLRPITVPQITGQCSMIFMPSVPISFTPQYLPFIPNAPSAQIPTEPVPVPLTAMPLIRALSSIPSVRAAQTILHHAESVQS